jgi:DNA-binding CsgD family transcriptional regulator/PAS domain-containing protein
MGGPHNFITEISLTLIGVLMGIEAVVLLRMGKKTRLHFVAAAFSLIMGAFIALFGFSGLAMSVKAYTALSRVSELMSILVIPLFLHGILLLSNKNLTKRSWSLQVLIYLPALVLIACSARELILVKSFFLDESGVWNGVNRTEGWPTLLFWVYAIGCIVAGMGLLFSWWFRAGGRAEKRLSRRLNLATALVLAAFSTSMVGNLAYLYRNSPWLDFLLNLFFTLSFYAWIVAYRKAIVGMTGGAAEAAWSGSMAGREGRSRINRGLLGLFSQPVFLLDREGRIEHCNQAAAALVGTQGGELRGRPLAESFVEGERLAEALRSPRGQGAFAARSSATGRALTLALRAILGEAGMVAGYLCQCHDAGADESPVREEAAAARELLLPGEEISAREYEVLFLLAEGLDVDGIGRRLFIAPSTVKTHIHHLYQKTGARNRVDLIKLVDAK